MSPVMLWHGEEQWLGGGGGGGRQGQTHGVQRGTGCLTRTEWLCAAAGCGRVTNMHVPVLCTCVQGEAGVSGARRTHTEGVVTPQASIPALASRCMAVHVVHVWQGVMVDN
jgi:hypothetical protein